MDSSNILITKCFYTIAWNLDTGVLLLLSLLLSYDFMSYSYFRNQYLKPKISTSWEGGFLWTTTSQHSDILEFMNRIIHGNRWGSENYNSKHFHSALCFTFHYSLFRLTSTCEVIVTANATSTASTPANTAPATTFIPTTTTLPQQLQGCDSLWKCWLFKLTVHPSVNALWLPVCGSQLQAHWFLLKT